MSWFGSLDLAVKYAIVFGSALGLTLLAGVTKLMIDRQRMKGYVKDAEAEAGRKAFSNHSQVQLNMREKDEGDLFGIRAIEAGFYGGVAQSAPTSAANSPVGSRSGSPAPGRRTPKTHSPSSSTALNGSRTLTPLNTFSTSSSILSLGQFQQNSNGQPEFMQPSRTSNFRVEQYNSDIEVYHPVGPVPPGHPYNAKLRPSWAELSGRIKHPPVDMTLEVPPSPLFSTYPRASREHECVSPSSIHHLSPQKFGRASFDRVSHGSSASYDFPSQFNNYDGSSTLPQPTLSPPDYFGKRTYEIASSTKNPHSAIKSMQGSIANHTITSSQWAPAKSQRLPAPPPKLPAFPKTAIIDSSSPLFKGFVSERRPKEVQGGLQGDSAATRRYFGNQEESQPPISPTSTITERSFTVDRRSRRTSFSFCMTNPDAYDSELAYSNIRSRLGEKPMSSMNQNQGTYRPKGAPPDYF